MLTTPAAHDERLRNLEAAAFRTTHTLTEHTEQLTALRKQHRTIAAPAERTINDRLHTIEQRLDTIERVLFALARAQGIDPEPETEPRTPPVRPLVD